jgi:GxxExxY protein
MRQSRTPLLHGDVTDAILQVYYQARHEFGHGFLEILCQRVMVMALRQAGLQVAEATPCAVHFRGEKIGHLIFDIIVNGVVLIEVKSCAGIEPRHQAQVINYLRASELEVGLLLNFGPKPEFERIIFTNARKHLAPEPPSPSGTSGAAAD